MKKQCVLLFVCLWGCAVMLMLLPSVIFAEDHQEQVALPSASVPLEDDYFTHFSGHLVTSYAKYTGTDPTELREKLAKAGNAEGTTGILKKLWEVMPVEKIDLRDAFGFVIKSAPAFWSSDDSKKTKVTAILKQLVNLIPLEYLGYLWTELRDCPRCRDYAYDFTVNLGTTAWDKIKTGGQLVSDTAASFKNWIWNSSEQGNNTDGKSENTAEQKPSFWSTAWSKANELGNSALQTGSNWLSEKTASMKDSLSELGDSAWQKTKEGGKWIGEKATSAWDSVTDGVAAGWKWVFN